MASGCAPPVLMLINRRFVFNAKPSAGGKLYINEKKENSKSHKKNKMNV